MSDRVDVLVIGGGVIGLACANALLDAGRSVRVLERERPGSGASEGNCGLITPGHALPLTRPGMVGKVLRWMLRSDSPIYVRPRLDWDFYRWAWRAARSCRPESMLATLRGRARLLESSRDLYVELLEGNGLSCEWQPAGLLEVFATEEAMEETEPERRLLEENGIGAELLDREELSRREPALRDGMAGACWYERDAHLRPDALVSELARVVRGKGGRIDEGCPVSGLAIEGGRVTAVSALDGERRAGHYVLAAGAWSPRLGRSLGARLPVQPGKGYSITFTRPEPCPRHPLLLREANMAVTPWESGYRIGGTMEFSGFDKRLTRARLDALHAGTRRFLKHPHLPSGEEWCGFRPMTPDELPIIGPLPGISNALAATGHGMMGVSMAPATGRLVAEMIEGVETFVDPAPYSPARWA